MPESTDIQPGYIEASAIVDALIDDLVGRKGLGNEWDELDPDMQYEIRGEWIDIAREIIDV